MSFQELELCFLLLTSSRVEICTFESSLMSQLGHQRLRYIHILIMAGISKQALPCMSGLTSLNMLSAHTEVKQTRSRMLRLYSSLHCIFSGLSEKRCRRACGSVESNAKPCSHSHPHEISLCQGFREVHSIQCNISAQTPPKACNILYLPIHCSRELHLLRLWARSRSRIVQIKTL